MALSYSKKISVSLREITSKHDHGFYCLNCLHLFRTKNELQSHRKVYDFCGVVMPSQETKILEFNQYRKFNKTPSIIYADYESLITRLNECKNILQRSSTRKVREHIPSGYSISTI